MKTEQENESLLFGLWLNDEAKLGKIFTTDSTKNRTISFRSKFDDGSLSLVRV